MSADVQKQSGEVALPWVQVSWVCATCGARGSGYKDPVHHDMRLEALQAAALDNHIMRCANRCPKPDVSVTVADIDADKLLGTSAADIRARAVPAPALPAPAPAQIGSAGKGPWAKPDRYS